MKIEKIKKSGSKYRIILDNGEIINTFDNVILDNKLLYNKDIDEQLLEKIRTDTIYADIYHKVLRKIDRRLRSEKEIREYLAKSNVLKDDIEDIIYSLKSTGLINDYNFARAYTNDKMNLTLDGPYKIARDLENYNIDSYIIGEMINSYPKELIDQHIIKIINKRLKANKHCTGYVLKQKTIAYLVNLGYSREDINNHLDLIDYDTELLAKEMERYYKIYAKKYHDDELYKKLKAKLLSQGFRASDVNNYLNEKQF